MDEQRKAFGLPDDAFEDYFAARDGMGISEEDFEVDRENHESFLVFLRCSTLWRKIIPPMGGSLIYEGLDYTGVDVVIRMSGFRGDRGRHVFADIQIMEREALAELMSG